MNAVLLEQTTVQLTRQTSRWHRRLRLATSLIWVPRGLMVGLMAGIVVAVISRLRPWLLPEQIVQVAGVALVISAAGTLALVWLWPRSRTHRARYFDQRFGLKERISTALELTGGLLPYSDRVTERQLTDAVSSAHSVNLAARLPLRIYWREIVAVTGLVLLLGYLLFEDNPMSQKLRSQRDWQNALDSQIAELDQSIQQIEQNPALSAEQKDALTQPLEQARDILKQPDVTQEEAVAAMAEATQSLKDSADGMSPEQQAAYQNAGNQLSQAGPTGDMADALQKPDLNAAADSMDDLSQQVGNGELSQQQQQQLADQLDAAAQQLQQANPQMSQQLKEVADALRSGDQQAAQQAMEKAADSAREQQEQNQNSPAAQAAQGAAQQAQQSERDLAEAGQQITAQQSGEPQAAPEGAQPPDNAGQPGQQDQQPSSDQGQESQPQGDQAQPGSNEEGQNTAGQEQMAQPGEGQPQSGEGQTTQEEAGSGQSDQGEGQPSSTSADSGSQQGQGEGTDAQPSAGNPTTGSQSEQSGSLSAGSGEGGAGTDTTTGTMVDANGQEIPTNNGIQEGTFEEYTPQYNSTTLGGPVDQTLDVGGQGTGQEGEVVQEGEFGPNPAGESTLSYTGVYGSYQGIVSDALESGRIPLDQRDVIHDYFSSLDR